MPSVGQAEQAPIGFYAHHQGRGHATRIAQIAPHLRRPYAVFTSRPDYFPAVMQDHVVRLPLDLPEHGRAHPLDVGAPADCLHYAPLQVDGLRRRMASIADWIARRRPALFVVDLSVEVAMLARLLGVPTVVTRLQGYRNDAAHLACFTNARAILCPYPETLEVHPLPAALRSRAYYTGAYAKTWTSGRSDAVAGAAGMREVPSARRGRRRILVTTGSGGTHFTVEGCRELAGADPRSEVEVVGPVGVPGPDPLCPNLYFAGFVADLPRRLREADLVVCGAGSHTVMEVGAAGKPMVCLAEDRAFGEQRAKALGLARAGLAVSPARWPSAREWPSLLARAEQLDTSRWRELFVDPTLARAARFLERIAAESDEVLAPSRPTDPTLPPADVARARPRSAGRVFAEAA